MLALVGLTWLVVVVGQVFRAKELAAKDSLIRALRAANDEKDTALAQVLAWNHRAAESQRENLFRWLPANEHADAVTRGSVH